jgi:hypothetical protein
MFARRGMMRRTARRVFRRRLLVGGAVLFAVAGAAHKMSQKDVQKVEQQAGKPVEQMNEQELQAAMKKAGVQEQQITPDDERAMEAAEQEEKTAVP